MYFGKFDKIIDEAMEGIKESIKEEAAGEVADFLIEAEWDDVRAWLNNLDGSKRKLVLLQVMHVLSNAVDAGFVNVVFEQTDWHLDDDDQEDTFIQPERCEELHSVNISATTEMSGMNGDILFLTPANKRKDGRLVQVILSPNAGIQARP